MHIERFDATADQERLRACFEIWIAARQHDEPGLPLRSFAGFTAWWAHGYASNPRQARLACDDAGQPVGCYLLMLPERENTTMAMCELMITPAGRRSGLGTRLLAHCRDQARLAGRSRLAGEATDDSPGAAFAAAAGATSGITEVIRVLRVDSGLRSRLLGLRAEAQPRATGYTLESWLGACPEGRLDEVARLNGAMADAPRDAAVDPEVWDSDRIRTMEQVGIASGWQYHSVAARHDATGELAALTQLGTEAGVPGWAFQSLTAVLPAHRGHRLGLLTKVAMLELLVDREPGVRSIFTGNAGPNAHMIAINEQLGFEVRSVRRSWELDLTKTA
jgi:GNAT superfamily N-acetyltransferase